MLNAWKVADFTFEKSKSLDEGEVYAAYWGQNDQRDKPYAAGKVL